MGRRKWKSRPSPSSKNHMIKPHALYDARWRGDDCLVNRPERLNAPHLAVYRELTDTFVALRDQKDVRVVAITGAGRAFCSGGDVHDIIGKLFAKDMAGLLEFTRMTCDLIRSIRARRSR